MIILKGHVVNGVGDFTKRMTNFSNVFEKANGKRLIPGTLNVKVEKPVPVREDFKIEGAEIGEANQDLLFENCRIKYEGERIRAYRIRPHIHTGEDTGKGGHGDDILEIACYEKIPNIHDGSEVEIELFRDDIAQ